jgi:hypothetical protein
MAILMVIYNPRYRQGTPLSYAGHIAPDHQTSIRPERRP